MRAHGTRAKYVGDGCRCDACRTANRLYERRRMRHQIEAEWGARPPLLTDAEPARRHLLELSSDGIGLRRVAAVSGPGRTPLQRIRSGEIKRVHQRTAAAILRVDADDARSDGALIDAAPARRYVDALRRRGWTKGRIALAMGARQPALQILRGARCTRLTERKLELLAKLAAPEALDGAPETPRIIRESCTGSYARRTPTG